MRIHTLPKRLRWQRERPESTSVGRTGAYYKMSLSGSFGHHYGFLAGFYGRRRSIRR